MVRGGFSRLCYAPGVWKCPLGRKALGGDESYFLSQALTKEKRKRMNYFT